MFILISPRLFHVCIDICKTCKTGNFWYMFILISPHLFNVCINICKTYKTCIYAIYAIYPPKCWENWLGQEINSQLKTYWNKKREKANTQQCAGYFNFVPGFILDKNVSVYSEQQVAKGHLCKNCCLWQCHLKVLEYLSTTDTFIKINIKSGASIYIAWKGDVQTTQ